MSKAAAHAGALSYEPPALADSLFAMRISGLQHLSPPPVRETFREEDFVYFH
jgi:hypothetical protein